MASESKKEAFRKYLEASGVLDSLTKVLVALYEEHDKPPIALEFIRKALGGPTLAEYEQLLKEKNDLVAKHDGLVIEHEECCRKLLEFLPPLPEDPLSGALSTDGSGAAPPPIPVPQLPAKPLSGPPPANSKAPAVPTPAAPTPTNSKAPAAPAEKFKASPTKK